MESGSRLWIVLSSASQTTDGEFKFRGTLLLPAAIGNSIVLDRGTEVSGSGRNNQKETLLQLTEIHAGGVQYVLKRTAGTNAHAPGAGPAVRFDSGQVLEMWLSVESVYERQPGK